MYFHIFNSPAYCRWSGINDGRHNSERLVELVRCDEYFSTARNRIQVTDLLIIDEISMLSAKLLDTLDFLCRQIIDSSPPFGGLQPLLGGDFYQLPPVPNALYEDRGDMAFEAHIWSIAFCHKIELTEVVRQNEPDLIQVWSDVFSSA
jgi:ATP-dependent DNA helicase PIF1